MIDFHYELDFNLGGESDYSDWINRVLDSENFTADQIDYVFCNDDYLHKINVEYLQHDTLTDIITFDYSHGDRVGGDIFVSVDRVKDNAESLGTELDEELKRVMIHGVLHLMGYEDKTEREKVIMRKKEDEKIKMFHVEQ
ncbi:rRNA maturation RNase YbeY [Flagellimonas flava]|uniref:Endoribonuclease YbeY n=1 Tax=Flagellimonas flava TaxID=570519 RepID=A0A1M5KZS9_9FLAO|nr:rRNA maturation RNase YbeY [Allomuricauda flava]SHG58324.1 rRNA maturation RNase YbeY [Allomuricauda flava]